MKVFFSKVSLKIILPIIIWILIIIITNLYPFYLKEYLNIFISYILINYFIVIITLFITKDKELGDSIYVWLDNLNGGNILLENLFREKKNSDIKTNLEIIKKELLIYTKHELNTLKLLRGYYKTLNEDGPMELLNKTVLGIMVTISIWGISRGSLWNLSISDSVEDVNPIYVSILNYLTFIFLGYLYLIVFIKDFYKNKRRNNIILEVLDICISEKEK